MEYLFQLGGYTAGKYILDTSILTQDKIDLLSGTEKYIYPYLILGIVIYVITLIINIMRATKSCYDETDGYKSFGIMSSFRLGIYAIIGALIGGYISNHMDILLNIINSMTFITDPKSVNTAVFTGIFACLLYWVGRMSISIC